MSQPNQNRLLPDDGLVVLLQRIVTERLQAGATAEAVILLSHLAALQPAAEAIHEQLISLLAAQGQLLAALTQLAILKSNAKQPEEALNRHLDIISAAIREFKRLADNAQLEVAERFISLLTELLPDNAMIISAALQFHHGLEQHEKSLPYAHRMLRLEPNQSDALLVLIDECRRNHDARGEVALRLAKMDHNTGSIGVHQAHNIYELVNVMMCQTLTAEDFDNIERAQTVLHAIPRPNADTDRGEAWTRFYQTMVGGIHIPALRRPPKPIPRPIPRLYSASGDAITFADVQARALRVQAEAIFLVAGDEGYVQRYARVYIRSVLANADLSCMVLVHVIGGERRMAKIAGQIGETDDRLIFSGDDFDPGQIGSLVYDAPSQPQTTKPIGHYQSIRFHHAGMLLYGLKIPVFMTDIDCMLERGVRDLLIDHADKDMVLNENRAVIQFASRLTANLLLLFPTEAARRYMMFMSNYLDIALQPSELPKFIDQIAMLVGRHFIQRTYPDVKIAYFDVNSDINNCVYTKYVEHPFRFLSLYQKFDLTSLPVY